MPFSFGVVSLTSQAFSGHKHGMVGAEGEKGDPRPKLPLPPGCFGGRKKPGTVLEGLRLLLLLIAEASRGPACSKQREASGARAAFLSLCCQGAEASMPVAETKAPILTRTLGG